MPITKEMTYTEVEIDKFTIHNIHLQYYNYIHLLAAYTIRDLKTLLRYQAKVTVVRADRLGSR